MKFISKVCTTILILLIMLGITYANKDRKGSSDHPLISRMPDFWIAAYQESEYDSHAFRDSANNKINIEGHKYFIEYRLKKGGWSALSCQLEHYRFRQKAESKG